MKVSRFGGLPTEIYRQYASITASLRKLTEKDVKFKWGPTEQTAFEQFKESITDDETMIYFNKKKKKKKAPDNC